MRLKSIKSTALVCAICMMLCWMLCIGGSLAATEAPVSPWSDKDIKVNVYSTLEEMENKSLLTGAGVAEIKDGKYVITASSTAWYATSEAKLNSPVSLKGALGAGFYVENNTEKGVYLLCTVWIDNIRWNCGAQNEGQPFTVYDAEQKSSAAKTVGANGTWMVPAGFKGYVALPFAAYKNSNGKTITDDSKVTGIGALWGGGALSSGEVVLDNFFIYGYDVEEHNDGIISREVLDLEALAHERKAELETRMNELGQITPEWKYVPDYDPKEYPTVKAITYDGAKIGNKKTKIFAYIGWPEGAKKGDKLPAIVLIHGAGGHAFANWVKYWNDNGYVAIAMDTNGYYPKNNTAGGFTAEPWVLGLNASETAAFKEDGYVSLPLVNGFGDADKPLEQQWIYHAVAQGVLARNLLAADPTVDSEKIGVTGISQGSTTTGLLIGYARFAFAVPQYAGGHNADSLTHIRSYILNSGSVGAPIIWKAEDRFDKVNFPVLWMEYTKDICGDIYSDSLCYLDTLPYSQMSARINWLHTHDWTTPIEILRFANSVVNGGEILTKVKNQPNGSRSVDVDIELPSDASRVTAQAYYITEKLSYSYVNGKEQCDNTFKSVDLKVNGNKITGILPEEAYSFYVEISTVASGKTYYTATAFMDVDHTKEVINKDDLNKAIEDVKALEEKDYTQESWALLTETLKQAEEVTANSEATQEQIDSAKEALLNAVKELRKLPGSDEVESTGDNKRDLWLSVAGLCAVCAGFVGVVFAKRKAAHK